MASDLRIFAGLGGTAFVFAAGACADMNLPAQSFALSVMAIIWLFVAFAGRDL